MLLLLNYSTSVRVRAYVHGMHGYPPCMSLHVFQDAVEEILMVMFRDKIKVKQVNVLLLI